MRKIRKGEVQNEEVEEKGNSDICAVADSNHDWEYGGYTSVCSGITDRECGFV